MAIFQRKFERLLTIDDTEQLSATIESSQTVDGHTEYVLRVQRGPTPDNSWLVHRRYNDFVDLHKCLAVSGLPLPMPEKKIFGNMHPDFVAKRLIALQHYINVVFMNPILASSLPSRRFVDPEVYNQSFADLAIQNASLCLRNDGQYVLGLSLGAIGWRLRKHYFRVTNKSTSSKGSDYVKTGGKHVLVKSSSQSAATAQQLAAGTATAAQVAAATTAAANELTLTWTEYGPDKYLDDKECMGVIKSLAAASHPYIQPIEYVAGNDSGVLVVRRFAARGTVKDLLCGSQPKSLFLQKYGNPNGRNALAVRDIALWSRQILEALRFLHEKGMPFGHCHAGNVIIVDGQARLLDVENFVLGVASFYRPYFMQHSKIFTAECIDVYSFGHLVYEMATGHALQESVARHPIEATGSLKTLLDSILSKEACRVGLPTLDQLAAHSFFAEHAPGFADQYAAAIVGHKPNLKLSATARDQLLIAAQRTELRLQNEQKSTKNQKRLVKIQEMMSSEEEKKKNNKQKAKLEHKQQKLRQQNSLQLNSVPSSTASAMPRSDSIHGVSAGHFLSPLSPPPAAPTLAALSIQSHPHAPTAPSTSSHSSSSTGSDMRPISSATATSAVAINNQLGATPEAHNRSALLSSINGFNKSNLRKVA